MKQSDVLQRLLQSAARRQVRDEQHRRAVKSRCEILKASLVETDASIGAYEMEVDYNGGAGRYSKAEYAAVLARQAHAMHMLATMRLERDNLIAQHVDESAQLETVQTALMRGRKKRDRLQRSRRAAIGAARNATEKTDIHDLIEIKSYVQIGGNQSDIRDVP
jgi:hypothetical protein